MKINTKLLFLFAILIIVDQIAKNISAASFCNPNIAWSIPIAPTIFYFAWFAIIAALGYFFFRTESFNQKLFLIFVFSGAVSNIIDRIRLGCVIDYIDLKIWPVFNLADVYIAIGIIFILIFNFQCLKIDH